MEEIKLYTNTNRIVTFRGDVRGKGTISLKWFDGSIKNINTNSFIFMLEENEEMLDKIKKLQELNLNTIIGGIKIENISSNVSKIEERY